MYLRQTSRDRTMCLELNLGYRQGDMMDLAQFYDVLSTVEMVCRVFPAALEAGVTALDETYRYVHTPAAAERLRMMAEMRDQILIVQCVETVRL